MRAAQIGQASQLLLKLLLPFKGSWSGRSTPAARWGPALTCRVAASSWASVSPDLQGGLGSGLLNLLLSLWGPERCSRGDCGEQ